MAINYSLEAATEVPQPKRKLLTTATRAVADGAIVLVVLVLVDQLSGRLGLTGLERTGDNLLGGMIVGMLVFVDERRRQRYLGDRLRIIALMNHHVRNSLQTIKFAHTTDKEVELIGQAVARIEWALREILPGELNGHKPETSAEMRNL